MVLVLHLHSCNAALRTEELLLGAAVSVASWGEDQEPFLGRWEAEEIKAKTVLSTLSPGKSVSCPAPHATQCPALQLRHGAWQNSGRRDGFGSVTWQGRNAAEFIFAAGSSEMLWKDSAAKGGLEFQVHFDIFPLWYVSNLAIKHITFVSDNLTLLSLPEAADGVVMGWSCIKGCLPPQGVGGLFLQRLVSHTMLMGSHMLEHLFYQFGGGGWDWRTPAPADVNQCPSNSWLGGWWEDGWCLSRTCHE